VIDPKGNRLTVGPNGRAKANVNASAVVVQGKPEGEIQASGRVDLKQSAVVTGDIAAQHISIDEGPYFKERVNIHTLHVQGWIRAMRNQDDRSHATLGDFRLLRVPLLGHHSVPRATLDYPVATRITLVPLIWRPAMGNIVPASARPILERALDIVRMRANSNGECFGAEITEALQEAGTALGADGLEVLLTRTLLVRTMESLGETYPSEVLHNFETRMRVSEALRYLRETIDSTARLKNSPELPIGENGSELRTIAIE